jgi:hypothetical protein
VPWVHSLMMNPLPSGPDQALNPAFFRPESRSASASARSLMIRLWNSLTTDLGLDSAILSASSVGGVFSP